MPKLPDDIREELVYESVKCLFLFDRITSRDKHGNLVAQVYFTLPPKSNRNKATVHGIILPIEDWLYIGLFLVQMSGRLMREVSQE